MSSAFKSLMEYAKREHPDLAGDIECEGKGGAINGVAELMRRINYQPRRTPRIMQWWRAATDPKEALRSYKVVANDMNMDELDSIRHELECRAAAAKGIAAPPPPVFTSEEEPERLVPLLPLAAEPAAEAIERPDQALDAVIDRLFEEAPLEDEAWGAW
jgi:hypothetical protein